MALGRGPSSVKQRFPATEHSPESVPKPVEEMYVEFKKCHNTSTFIVLAPGRHGVVEDGIDSRVYVEHQPAEIQNVEI